MPRAATLALVATLVPGGEAAGASAALVVSSDVRAVEAWYSTSGVNPCPDATFCEQASHGELGGRFLGEADRPEGAGVGGGLDGALVSQRTVVSADRVCGSVSGYASLLDDSQPIFRVHGESTLHTEFAATEDGSFELEVEFFFSGDPGQNVDAAILNNRIEFSFEGVDTSGEPFHYVLSYGLEEALLGGQTSFSFTGDVRAGETMTVTVDLVVDRNWNAIAPSVAWLGTSIGLISFEIDFFGRLFSDGFESGDLSAWGGGGCPV